MLSGMVAVVGRPNVGKSSLVNALVGQKISIVTAKPQTTRHRIQGVVHDARGQIVLVDTPGLHKKSARALNRYLNDAAVASLQDIDLVLWVVESGRWTEEDDAVLERLQRVKAPVGLVVNKVDRIGDKKRLLPELAALAQRREFAFVVPASALKKDNLEPLKSEIFARLPEGPPLYGEDQVEGAAIGFSLGEIVREKLMERLRQELPYSLTVEVEKLEREGRLTRVSAVIWVERDSQKAIVIGEGGKQLKAIGGAARRDMEARLGGKVFLQLWCKVKAGWTDDAESLKRFGYVTE